VCQGNFPAKCGVIASARPIRPAHEPPLFPFTKGRDLYKVTVRNSWLQNFCDDADYLKYFRHKMNMKSLRIHIYQVQDFSPGNTADLKVCTTCQFHSEVRDSTLAYHI
jgi:hypothetical protein